MEAPQGSAADGSRMFETLAQAALEGRDRSKPRRDRALAQDQCGLSRRRPQIHALSDSARQARARARLRHGRPAARRYALFTLVEIAGEDDLDAPDLAAAGLSLETPENPPRAEHGAAGSDQ